MEYVRKNLSDQDWGNFIAVLNGQDPFPEEQLPQSEAPVEPATTEPAVPTSLANIERVTGEAEALCLKPAA